jgi:hypothetical protein
MGGKSRKTGGVSKALIDRIKSGGNTSSKCKPKKLKNENEFNKNSLFKSD